MAHTEYIAGVDVGTSGVKAIAFSIHGKQLAIKKQAYEVLRASDEKMEHDPGLILQNTLHCIDELVYELGYPPVAIGLCTFMHSIMPVDKHIKPLGNLQLWNDNRSAQVAIQLKNSPVGRSIYECTGTPIHPMSPLSKIAMMKLSDPELFNNAAYFIGVKEYLLFHFTGRLILDFSTASATGLFDAKNKCWHSGATGYAGISEKQLAVVVDPFETFPCILGGQFREVRIVSGLSDGVAANLGSACIATSDFTLTLGTSGALRFTGNTMRIDPEGVLFSYCLDEKFYVTGGASNNCLNVIEKLSGNLNVNLQQIPLTKQAVRDHAANDLVFLPWMFGERAPVQLFSPVSQFINRKPFHTSGQLMLCALECILFNLKHIAEKLQELNGREFSQLHLSGGISQVDIIKTLASRIFNLPMAEHSTGESSALGTAFFTALVLGFAGDMKEIEVWNPVVATHLPDVENAAFYRNLYRQFREISQEYIGK